MAIEDLVAVCRPPAKPRDAGGDWGPAQAALGPLPADYRALIEAYGSGSFSGFIHVLTPFGTNQYVDLVAVGRETLDADRQSREKFPDKFKVKLHPEPGGLLPCATTDNGDTIYWITEGAPDAWTIFVLPSRELVGETHPVGLTAFLAGWLGGTRASDALGPDATAEFTPSRA